VAAAAGMGGPGMVKSASYSALSGLDGAVTSSLAATSATDPAAAAAAAVPLSSLPASARGALRGELTHVHLQPMGGDTYCQQPQHMASSFDPPSRGMTRVQSVPQLRTYGSDAGSPTLPPMSGGGGHTSMGSYCMGTTVAIPGLPCFGSGGGSGGFGTQYDQQQQQQQPQQWMGSSMGQQQQHQQQQVSAFSQGPMQATSMAVKAETAYWTPELSYPVSCLLALSHEQSERCLQQRASGSCCDDIAGSTCERS
jgi:hypothetical protein